MTRLDGARSGPLGIHLPDPKDHPLGDGEAVPALPT